MADRLYDAVIAFSEGAPQLDDMTVVIVKKMR
jgi:serine phosphatase RsbU (regulator of sigma subunit)